jgi:Family of unknown function (DUF6496)
MDDKESAKQVSAQSTICDATPTAVEESQRVEETMAPKKAAKKSATKKATKKTSAKKAPAKKSAKKSGSTRKYSPAAGKSVETEMKAMKQGKLKSGRSGKKVTNPKQAIAIGLSEARKAGKRVPPAPKKD